MLKEVVPFIAGGLFGPLPCPPRQLIVAKPVATPLLRSKLRPPRLPARLVERASLLELLDEGQRQKLTLVQAPAGSGKSTLVAQWIAQHEAQAATRHNSLLVAW